MVDVGALQRTRPARSDDVRTDDRRFVDLHRQPGHRPGHARNVCRNGSSSLRRRPQRKMDSHGRARRHGRRAAARRNDGGRKHAVHRVPAESDPETARHKVHRRAGAVSRRCVAHDRRGDEPRPRDFRRRAGQCGGDAAGTRAPRCAAACSHGPDVGARSGERLSADRMVASRSGSILRTRDPQTVVREAQRSAAIHVRAMLDYHKMGVPTFDYGNNIRQVAFDEGVRNAFDFPGFVPAYIRPLFCRGVGPSAGSRCLATRKTSIAPTRK